MKFKTKPENSYFVINKKNSINVKKSDKLEIIANLFLISAIIKDISFDHLPYYYKDFNSSNLNSYMLQADESIMRKLGKGSSMYANTAYLAIPTETWDSLFTDWNLNLETSQIDFERFEIFSKTGIYFISTSRYPDKLMDTDIDYNILVSTLSNILVNKLPLNIIDYPIANQISHIYMNDKLKRVNNLFKIDIVQKLTEFCLTHFIRDSFKSVIMDSRYKFETPSLRNILNPMQNISTMTMAAIKCVIREVVEKILSPLMINYAIMVKRIVEFSNKRLIKLMDDMAINDMTKMNLSDLEELVPSSLKNHRAILENISDIDITSTSQKDLVPNMNLYMSHELKYLEDIDSIALDEIEENLANEINSTIIDIVRGSKINDINLSIGKLLKSIYYSQYISSILSLEVLRIVKNLSNVGEFLSDIRPSSTIDIEDMANNVKLFEIINIDKDMKYFEDRYIVGQISIGNYTFRYIVDILKENFLRIKIDDSNVSTEFLYRDMQDVSLKSDYFISMEEIKSKYLDIDNSTFDIDEQSFSTIIDFVKSDRKDFLDVYNSVTLVNSENFNLILHNMNNEKDGMTEEEISNFVEYKKTVTALLTYYFNMKISVQNRKENIYFKKLPQNSRLLFTIKNGNYYINVLSFKKLVESSICSLVNAKIQKDVVTGEDVAVNVYSIQLDYIKDIFRMSEEDLQVLINYLLGKKYSSSELPFLIVDSEEFFNNSNRTEIVLSIYNKIKIPSYGRLVDYKQHVLYCPISYHALLKNILYEDNISNTFDYNRPQHNSYLISISTVWMEDSVKASKDPKALYNNMYSKYYTISDIRKNFNKILNLLIAMLDYSFSMVHTINPSDIQLFDNFINSDLMSFNKGNSMILLDQALKNRYNCRRFDIVHYDEFLKLGGIMKTTSFSIVILKLLYIYANDEMLRNIFEGYTLGHDLWTGYRSSEYFKKLYSLIKQKVDLMPYSKNELIEFSRSAVLSKKNLSDFYMLSLLQKVMNYFLGTVSDLSLLNNLKVPVFSQMNEEISNHDTEDLESRDKYIIIMGGKVSSKNIINSRYERNKNRGKLSSRKIGQMMSSLNNVKYNFISFSKFKISESFINDKDPDNDLLYDDVQINNAIENSVVDIINVMIIAMLDKLLSGEIS